MTREKLEALITEYPLPKGWVARVLELQELAKHGTDWETGIYEEQVRSGYRLPLHPLVLRMFDHYHMAPGQLVPNGWRKLVGIIYVIETSNYKAEMKNGSGKKIGFLGALKKEINFDESRSSESEHPSNTT
ncbi:hypothetical protein RJ639_014940 [Escallonia herrerae]|uniref:Transposase (putative) gypsy type domain-containing protein n=1 Tax=Escallonia herrerae TaxID=1293975 RepID=A0AA88VL17_9ASTE|nr:hypothetical protein RJ639_014940 [Escallonia herrerae]